MEIFLTFLHVLAAVFMVVVVLLQQGKGADIGSAFGAGASQTVFGSRGAGNFLTKLTTVFVAMFMTTSIALTYYNTPRSILSGMDSGAAPAAPSAPAPAPAPSEAQPIPGSQPPADGSGTPSGFEAVPPPTATDDKSGAAKQAPAPAAAPQAPAAAEPGKPAAEGSAAPAAKPDAGAKPDAAKPDAAKPAAKEPAKKNPRSKQ